MPFKVDWASLIVGSKFTVFALFSLVFEGTFPSIGPLGGLYVEGRFNGGFFCVTGLGRSPSNLMGSWFGGLIFGGAYFRNFTVLHKNMSLKKSLKKRSDMNIQEKVTKRRK